MATVSDLRSYLGSSSDQWSDEEMASVLASEVRAQAVRCNMPDPVPADLEEALKRRVARNLAMRKIPLGIATFADAEAKSVGTVDPEIRRLEAPYRRLVVG